MEKKSAPWWGQTASKTLYEDLSYNLSRRHKQNVMAAVVGLPIIGAGTGALSADKDATSIEVQDRAATGLLVGALASLPTVAFLSRRHSINAGKLWEEFEPKINAERKAEREAEREAERAEREEARARRKKADDEWNAKWKKTNDDYERARQEQAERQREREARQKKYEEAQRERDEDREWYKNESQKRRDQERARQDREDNDWYENFKKKWSGGFTPKNPFYTAAYDKYKMARTKADAKSIYRKLALEIHPDKTKHSGRDTTEEFKHANNAWDDFQKSRDFDKLSSLQKIALRAMFNEMTKYGI